MPVGHLDRLATGDDRWQPHRHEKGVPDLEFAPISSPHVRGVDEASVIESVQHRLVRPAPRPGPRSDQEPAVRGRPRYPETRPGTTADQHVDDRREQRLIRRAFRRAVAAPSTVGSATRQSPTARPEQFNSRPQGGGTAPCDERAVFTAVVYVLTSGCAWRHLPETFGVSPSTAHRRFTAWTRGTVASAPPGGPGRTRCAGRAGLGLGDRRCRLGPGQKRGTLTGPNPVDRGK